MKKISNATTLTIEKIAGLKLTIGWDLGDRSSWYCVLGPEWQILLEEKVSTTPKALQARFGKMPRPHLRWRSSQTLAL